MISITPLAQEKLSAYLAENKVEPKVRLYLPDGDCCGAEGQIALALDQPEAGDVRARAGDLELFMTRALYEQVGRVTVDFQDDGRDSGFVVLSEKPAPQAGPSGCGGCSCCG
ncbi:MAG: hypothetical protein LBP33_00105 [Candidatus Adiutrix sp.]|jgi:Fe-S cluster assembly iron-binding protein IscA|nr:hypothetical protein [Candidatus Adiutrix sp.]